MKAVNCTHEHFETKNKNNHKLFENWDGFSILCPEAIDIGNYSLSGTTQSVANKAFIFQISKCSNETLEPHQEKCKTPEEINKYVKNITIDSWSNYEKVAMSNHKDRPTKRKERWIT